MACGIALSIIAELGTSPISSFPYVLSLISSFTVGTGTIAMNAGFMILQMLLLRKRYDPRQLVQLPAAVVMDGDGLAIAVSTTLNRKFGPKKRHAFGNCMITVDTSLVVIATVLSFAVLGRVEGIREGTLAAALLVGFIAKYFVRWLEPLQKYL